MMYKMKIDAAKIAELLKVSSDKKRVRIGISVDPDVWAAFKARCGKGAASRVVEEFMRQVTADDKKKK